MKKYIITALALLVVSCSLEEKSYMQVDDSYINNSSLAETVLLGVYQPMKTDGIYRRNISMLFTMPNDIVRVQGNDLTGIRADASNAFTASSSTVQDTWSQLYKGVYNANDFLEMMGRNLTLFEEGDKRVGEVFIAEARALRALYYFELIRWFGNIPLVTSTFQSYQPYDKYVQADPTEVYNFIEKDLLYAVENLPWADEDTIRENASFRFSKGAALGLLAKVYATWAGYPLQDKSKWVYAADAAAQLITSGHHSLLEDFEDLWRNAGNNVWDNTESLIELSYWSPLSVNETCGRVGNFNGVSVSARGVISGYYHFAYQRAVPTFIAGWKDYKLDKRWATSYSDYEYREEGPVTCSRATIGGVQDSPVSFEMAMDEDTPGWNITWRVPYNYALCPRKWDTEVYVKEDNQKSDLELTNVNWYVLRYADVLLLYAEAINEKDGAPSPEAFKAVNIVRRRGFGLDMNTASEIADLPLTLSYEEFQKAVRDERAYELAFEGHRRQDLVRWGLYTKTVLDTYTALGDWHYLAPDNYIGAQYTKENKTELLPIPQREKDMCIKFTQNPGW